MAAGCSALVFLLCIVFLCQEQSFSGINYYFTEYSQNSIVYKNSLHFSDSKIAMCLMVRDDMDALEWIVYHNRLGINKFYVYDNGSKPPMKSLLQPFIDSNLVTYEVSHGRNMNAIESFISQYFFELRDPNINKQAFIYEKCTADHGRKHEWLAYLDNDEFIRVNPVVGQGQSKTFEQILDSQKQDCAGLRLPWMMFGSSGFVSRPAGGVLGHYYKCYQDIQFKSISQTRYLTGKSFIHDMEYIPGKASCLSAEVRIDHYSIKSLEDYKLKMKRGAGNSVSRRMDYFENVNKSANKTCEILYMPPKRPDTVSDII